MDSDASKQDQLLQIVLYVIASCVFLYSLRLIMQRFRVIFCLSSTENQSDILIDESRPTVVPTVASSGEIIIELDSTCPVRRHSRSDESTCCPICLDEIEIDQRVRHLPCNHIHHDKCIIMWLVRANRCPICNQPPLKLNDDEEESSGGSAEAVLQEEVPNLDSDSEQVPRLQIVRNRITRTRDAAVKRFKRALNRRGRDEMLVDAV